MLRCPWLQVKNPATGAVYILLESLLGTIPGAVPKAKKGKGKEEVAPEPGFEVELPTPNPTPYFAWEWLDVFNVVGGSADHADHAGHAVLCRAVLCLAVPCWSCARGQEPWRAGSLRC